MRVLVSFLLILLCAGSGHALAEVAIHGKVTDSSGAVIPGATIRVLNEHRLSIRTAHSGEDGHFEIHLLSAGTYLFISSAPGFSDTLNEIRITKSSFTSSFSVKMHPLDCDAPGVNCDIFSAEPIPPETNPVVSRSNLTLALAGTVDLDRSRLVSAESAAANFQLSGNGGALYIVPINGTRFSSACGLNSGGRFRKSRHSSYRIDGLGPRSELCMRTSVGRLSKIFITRVIMPGDKQIEFSVVTRSK